MPERNGGGVPCLFGREVVVLLGQVVSMLCDIDLCCPHKLQTHPADACLIITTFPDQTIVGSYFDDEEAE